MIRRTQVECRECLVCLAATVCCRVLLIYLLAERNARWKPLLKVKLGSWNKHSFLNIHPANNNTTAFATTYTAGMSVLIFDKVILLVFSFLNISAITKEKTLKDQRQILIKSWMAGLYLLWFEYFVWVKHKNVGNYKIKNIN